MTSSSTSLLDTNLAALLEKYRRIEVIVSSGNHYVIGRNPAWSEDSVDEEGQVLIALYEPDCKECITGTRCDGYDLSDALTLYEEVIDFGYEDDFTMEDCIVLVDGHVKEGAFGPWKELQ